MSHSNSSSIQEDASESTTTSNGSSHARGLLTEGQNGSYPQLILFGDSITQNLSSTVQGRLQTTYTRRADVINRGFSGYTTTLALETLQYILPKTLLNAYQPPIRLLTIFFGANDACLPGLPQHVPLELYTSNIRHIATYPVFTHHNTKIILITPPPINEHQLTKPLTRTALRAQQYAQATKTLAKQLQLPCLDLWTEFMDLAGHRAADDADSHSQIPGSLSAPANSVLSALLLDGLHLSPQGYDVLYTALMNVIRDAIPECAPENMPMVLRDWKAILNV